MGDRGGRDVLRTAGRALEFGLARAPVVEGLYWRVAPSYYRWRIRRRLDHDAPLDPLKVVYVDPRRISRISGRRDAARARYRDLGGVRGGEWDRENRGRTFFSEDGFEGTALYRSFHERFAEGAAWEETELVRRLDAPYWKGRGITTEARAVAHLEGYDRLHGEIEANGYASRWGREGARGESSRVGYLDALTDEITVDVGRTGELCFVDGRHRLAIAKLLGLSAVPVVVLVRHREWMDERESRYRRPGRSEPHPDTVEFDGGGPDP